MSNTRLLMMPWYPDQFQAASLAMTWLERGLYRQLLDAQWLLGKLPTDLDRLRMISGWPEREFSEAWPVVSRKFVRVSKTFQVNKRLEEHRIRAQILKDRLSDAGRRGGFSKAAKARPVASPRPGSSNHAMPMIHDTKEEKRRARAGGPETARAHRRNGASPTQEAVGKKTEPDLRQQAATLRALHWSDERILAKLAPLGLTAEHLKPEKATEAPEAGKP